jgi:formamidopyrimidine-DNA glycosylase
VVETAKLAQDASLRLLGPDPLAVPRDGAALRSAARGARTSIKTWLLDQRRIAGLGNIYASEVLFRARIDPRRRAGALAPEEWTRVASEVPAVLEESIARMGTTFSTYRTIWNEPGEYGEQLLVYDRAGEPCRNCGTPLKRIVQSGRSTYFCPSCQRRERSSGSARKLAPSGPRKAAPRRARGPSRRGRRAASRRLSNH